jgi:hypothetical protein
LVNAVGEIVAFYSANILNINRVGGQNAEICNVKADGTYSNHCALKS